MAEPRAGGLDGVLAMRRWWRVEALLALVAAFIGGAAIVAVVILRTPAAPIAGDDYWRNLHRAVAVVVGESEKSQGPQEWWTFTCSGSLQSHTYCVVDAGYNRPGERP